MSERSIIAITGTGGSGKTNLAKRLETRLSANGHASEHISIGEYVRQQAAMTLGEGALRSQYRETLIGHLNSDSPDSPLDDEVIAGIVWECLDRSNAATMLLDGFPRYSGQLQTLFDISTHSDAYVDRALVTHVHEKEAVKRMQKRSGERARTAIEAKRRYHLQSIAIGQVVQEMHGASLPFIEIDTAYPKTQTLHVAETFLMTPPHYPHAPTPHDAA